MPLNLAMFVCTFHVMGVYIMMFDNNIRRDTPGIDAAVPVWVLSIFTPL